MREGVVGAIVNVMRIPLIRMKIASHLRKDKAVIGQLEEIDMSDSRWADLLSQHDYLQGQLIALEAELADMGEEFLQKAEDALVKHQSDEYTRPSGLFGAYINKKLGPLPVDAKKITVTVESMNRTGSYKGLVAILIIALAAFVFFCTSYLPLAVVGLTGYAYDKPSGTDYTSFSVFHVLALIQIGLFIIWPTMYSKLLYGLAIDMEQQYRMGSENWTWGQRGFSYIAPILANPLLFIFCPHFVIGFVCLPGVMMSKVYLDAYRNIGNHERAVFESAKLYVSYMKTLVMLASILIVTPWITHLITG